jgi:hypothetical protein
MIRTTEHTNGTIHHGNGFTVFADNQNGENDIRVYGWLGTWEDHDSAQHIDFDTVEDAIFVFTGN